MKLSDIVMSFDDAVNNFNWEKEKAEKALTEYISEKYPSIKDGTFIVRDADKICLSFTLYSDYDRVLIDNISSVCVDKDTKILSLD